MSQDSIQQYVPLNTLFMTWIDDKLTVEQASNEAFHTFALSIFEVVRNTEPQHWEDRYLRWEAVNQALASGLLRRESVLGQGWRLVQVQVAKLPAEEKASVELQEGA